MVGLQYAIRSALYSWFNLSNTSCFSTMTEYQYLVQEQMDKPLFDGIAELIDSSGTGSSVNLTPLAQRLFRNCECVHKKNHIMVDVKPDNIMFAKATAEKKNLPERLRFVDLGLWKRYTSESSDGAKVGDLTGNAMYCSLHMQELEKPVFRDDAQMMAIVLGEIVIRVHAALCNTTDQYEKTRVTSYLPWANGSNDQEVFRIKKENLLKSSSEFYKRMPPKAAKILFDLIQLTHNTGARSQPDYVAYSNLLKYLAVPKPAKRKTRPSRYSATSGAPTSQKTTSRGVARAATARFASASQEEGVASQRVTRSGRAYVINSGSEDEETEEGARPSPRKRPAVNDREMVVELLSSDEEAEQTDAEPMDIDETFDPFSEEQENVLNRRSNSARSSKPKAGIVLTIKRDKEELKSFTAYPGPTYSLGSRNAKATKSKICVPVPGLSLNHCELKVNGIPSKPSKLLSVDFKHVAKEGSTKVDREMLDQKNQSMRLEIAHIPTAQQAAKKLRIGDVVVEFKQLF